MNKMKEVAWLYKKHLQEPFMVKYKNTVAKCKFTNEGLYTSAEKDIWLFNRVWLNLLLNGEAKIIDP